MYVTYGETLKVLQHHFSSLDRQKYYVLFLNLQKGGYIMRKYEKPEMMVYEEFELLAFQAKASSGTCAVGPITCGVKGSGVIN